MNRLSKGYEKDACADIILDCDVIFPKKSFVCVNLNLSVELSNDELGLILPRSSAGIKGIFVSTAPIDPGYVGPIHAMVFNASDCDIEYRRGESFCQYARIKKGDIQGVEIRKKGERGRRRFGSTEKNGNYP